MLQLVQNIVLISTLSASTPEPLAVADAASHAQYYAANDGRAQVRLLIVDSRGRKMQRQFVVVRRDLEEGGEQNFLVRFERPADVRDTVFLVHKKPRGDDDRWLYLPALDLVKRIAASDERTSFVGSHLYYEDISGRSPHEDTHRLVDETESHWILESRPKDPGSVEFARYRARIRRSDSLPEEIVYFDDKGREIRKIEAAQIEVVDGHPTITRMKVSDLRTGAYTLAAFGKLTFDIGVPEDVFVERSLRNPPAQWFQIR
ncbi:MAG: outer membrane lipoprotein-sorting protein [Myxococcota bacterium]